MRQFIDIMIPLHQSVADMLQKIVRDNLENKAAPPIHL